MIIDGRLIASEIKSELKSKIEKLRQKNIVPQLAVILIGTDPGSKAYVRQKLKVGEEIGARVSIFNFQFSIFKKELLSLVNKLSQDKSVHGIIIQRPVPIEISKDELDLLVIPNKDVDGFHPKSPFTPPVASAVIKILTHAFLSTKSQHHAIARNCDNKDFENWLKKQKILLIGRGETAGKPIAETLKKIANRITIAHSQTTDLKSICLASDIIVTCVGRPNVVRRDMITTNTFLIGVGLHQEKDKLATDYDQNEISQKAKFYTPVPGGVGPVNVACLFENLLQAST